MSNAAYRSKERQWCNAARDAIRREPMTGPRVGVNDPSAQAPATAAGATIDEVAISGGVTADLFAMETRE